MQYSLSLHYAQKKNVVQITLTPEKEKDLSFKKTKAFREEIKCRLKAGNSCYYSVQTLLSSRFKLKYEGEEEEEDLWLTAPRRATLVN